MRAFLMFLFLSFYLFSFPAYAYIGPGAAVVFIGYIFGPLAAIIIAVLLVLAWPLRVLYKKIKARKNFNLQNEGQPSSDDVE